MHDNLSFSASMSSLLETKSYRRRPNMKKKKGTPSTLEQITKIMHSQNIASMLIYLKRRKKIMLNKVLPLGHMPDV